MRPRLRALVLLALLSFPGCEGVRLYAKDLMNPRASAAVSIPVEAAILLFVLPPALAWLPISIVPLLVFHDEPAVWFALAPGMLVGGPIVLLAGTPGYLLTEKPGPEVVAPVSSIAPVVS
jgi:hypothetical protein